MAFINILKSTFTGKLGEFIGQNYKGKPVVRSKQFSKAPPSNAQTQSVRAFEGLNRISGAIAKAGFSHLNLSAKEMLPHNAVAKWLKIAVYDHNFQPQLIGKIIPPASDFLLQSFTHNRASQTVSLHFVYSSSFVPIHGTKIFLILFNSVGLVYYSQLHDIDELVLDLLIPLADIEVLSVMAFLSAPTASGFNIYNFIYRRRPGMQYSLDEQPTGDTWLDGRPIYQQSFSFKSPDLIINEIYNYVVSTIPISTIISSEFSLNNNPSVPSIYLDNITAINSTGTNLFLGYTLVIFQTALQQLRVTFYAANQTTRDRMSLRDCFLTIRYTKV